MSEPQSLTVVRGASEVDIHNMRRNLYPFDDRPGSDSPRDGRTRVVLANDHPALRRSLRWLLEQENDLDVVGETSDFDDAVHKVSVHHPDVLVLDLRMPGGFSAERIKRLRAVSSATEIVVTTMQASETFAIAALSAGATGFVVADSADRELVEAVRRASRGLVYTSPRIRRAVA